MQVAWQLSGHGSPRRALRLVPTARTRAGRRRGSRDSLERAGLGPLGAARPAPGAWCTPRLPAGRRWTRARLAARTGRSAPCPAGSGFTTRSAPPVQQHGYDRHCGVFTQTFASDELDAGLLRLPVLGFVDWSDPRMLRTADATPPRLAATGWSAATTPTTASTAASGVTTRRGIVPRACGYPFGARGRITSHDSARLPQARMVAADHRQPPSAPVRPAPGGHPVSTWAQQRTVAHGTRRRLGAPRPAVPAHPVWGHRLVTQPQDRRWRAASARAPGGALHRRGSSTAAARAADRGLRAALRQDARSEGWLRAACGPGRPSHLPHPPAAVTGTATARLVAKSYMQDFRQAA